MLAMDVNDDAGYLTPRGARSTIASMLAPTGMAGLHILMCFCAIGSVWGGYRFLFQSWKRTTECPVRHMGNDCVMGGIQNTAGSICLPL